MEKNLVTQAKQSILSQIKYNLNFGHFIRDKNLMKLARLTEIEKLLSG